MANTVIQLKYSTVTSTPNSLSTGEPAYSYASNTFFIGSPDGTGSIAIGGKFYLDQQANIFNLVNAAFDAANTAVDEYAAGHANAAFDAANTNAGNITVLQGVDVTQNTSISNLEGVNLTQNTSITNLQGVNVTQNTNITNLEGVNTTQNTNITNAQNSADSAFVHANAAFDYANTAITTSGGTITGTLNVSSNVFIGGNLIVQGTQTVVDSTIVQVADNIVTLNAAIDQASAPVLDAGIEIDRGSSANVSLLWNESSDKWTATNDGTNYFNIGADSGETYANGAFLAANTAQVHANYGFNHANASFGAANTNATAITVLQGVNLTQNTSITNLEGVNVTQNTSISNLEGVNVTQNANITNAQNSADASFHHANAAFTKANTDYTEISISAGDFGGAGIVPTFHVAANGRIDSATNVSIAIAASQITSGTLGVARGGTGATSFTTNGVLLGQGTSALSTASSSTEGHVLTINDSGVPNFAMLQGGTF